jgi:hypothetical protein
MKRCLLLTVPALALAGLVIPVAADPVEADPFTITADAGPWGICAASFMGDEANGLAHQLIEQLRTRHQMAAYLFDRGSEEKRKDREAHEKMERDRGLPPDVHLPFKHPRYTPCCAVLIGGFPTMESANAALAKVKALKVPQDIDLRMSNGQPTSEEMIFVKPNEKSSSADMQRMKISPLANCFVGRNPLAPAPKVEAPKVDPLWKELNAPESFSLLKNSKRWTLVVKEYAGATVMGNSPDKNILSNQMDKVGRKPGEGMTAAGIQAHHLAEFLRDKRIGFDAYVLHTRTNSIVTVGGFSSPEDPELLKTKQRLEKLSFRGAGGGGVHGDPIGLIAHPLAMEVPRF